MSAPGDAPVRLRVESRPSTWSESIALPVSLSARPALSWVVPLTHTGQRQDGYRIRATRREQDGEVLWDSGVVESNENSGVVWGGPPLAPHDSVAWRVMTVNEHGAESEWSEAAEFLVPPLTAADWTGDWISIAPANAAVIGFLASGGPVRSAVLNFAAQGLVRVELDGHCVNAGARDPSDTALARVVLRSYDVTEHLLTGERHTLALVGARGHLHNVIDRVRMLAELRVTFDDGSVQVIATGPDWREQSTTLVHEDPFYTEEHDVRRAAGTAEPDPAAPPVRGGAELDAPGTAALPTMIEPDAGPPVRAVRSIHGTVLSATPDATVVDVGENVAARSVLRVSGTTSGQRITVIHGELLVDGLVSTLNITLPDDRDRERQVIDWTCGDTGSEVIEPWFAIHGFRYLEVRGLGDAVLESAHAAVTHSDAESTGTFASSDALLDRMVETAARTQLNNTHAHPEDCPTREQAGWTGDAAVSAEAALCHLDMAGVYRNWLVDVALDQQPDGGVLGISPFLLGPEFLQPADPVWGAALTEVSLQYWLATGDAVLIRQLLPAMRRWADWQVAAAPDGLVTRAAISYGADWLAIEQTPPVLLQTAAADVSIRTLARFEVALGDPDAAPARIRQADELRAAARARLWDPLTATWGNASQASFGVALASGWVEPEEHDAVAARLREAVDDAGGRLRSGFAGTQGLVRALGAIADGDTRLLDCIHEPTEPGIGAMLASGPGTYWETWWYDDPTLGIASLDHIGLVAPFAAWAWRNVGAIAPLEPGYRTFIVDPRPGSLASATVSRWTPRGLIVVHWDSTGDAIELELTVPVGATALLPDGRAVGSGTHRVTLARDAVPAASRESSPAPVAATAVPILWLGGGTDSGTWHSDGASSAVITERWICPPVFHEPLDPPIRDIVFGSLEAGGTGSIAVDLAQPLDPADADYVHASFDLDTGVLPGQRIVPFLAVLGQRGTRFEATTRWLPIAWNRVAVDLDGWPADEPIDRLELGVRWTGEYDTARGPRLPVPGEVADFVIRVGQVGASAGKRTW